MKTVEVYGTDSCRWCASALMLLQRRGIPFVYRNLTREPSLQDEFVARSKNATTVPQIFVGDIHVGGYTELNIADLDGSLQQMIGGN